MSDREIADFAAARTIGAAPFRLAVIPEGQSLAQSPALTTGTNAAATGVVGR